MLKKFLPFIVMFMLLLVMCVGCSSAGEAVHFALEKPADLRDAGGDELGCLHSDIQYAWEGFLTGD